MIDRPLINAHIQGSLDDAALEALRPALAPARADAQILRARTLLTVEADAWSELDLLYMVTLLQRSLERTRPELAQDAIDVMRESVGALVV